MPPFYPPVGLKRATASNVAPLTTEPCLCSDSNVDSNPVQTLPTAKYGVRVLVIDTINGVTLVILAGLLRLLLAGMLWLAYLLQDSPRI
jgi:hypothetical protein